MFAVDLEGAESGLYATLYGRFDSVEAYKFEAVVNAVSKDTKGIVLDFTNLEYISSVGLRKILQIRQSLAPEAEIEIKGANSVIVDTLRLTGFNMFVNISSTGEIKRDPSVRDLFDAQVRVRGEKLFVAGKEEYTFEQINRRAQKLAAILYLHGVHKGTHIGIYSINNLNWVIAFFAVQKCGGIAIPLNYNYTSEELVNLSHIGDMTHVCVGDASTYDDFDAFKDAITDKETSLIGQVIDIRSSVEFDPTDGEYAALGGQFREPQEAEDDCCMLFTSGSTGKPKAVLHSSASILHAAQCAVDILELNSGDRVCMNVPFFHTTGLIRCFLASLISGSRIELPGSFDTAEIISFIDERKCTIMNAFPTTLITLVNEPSFTSEKVASLRGSILVGAPVTEAQMHMLLKKIPNVKFVTSYGMSELSPITISKLGDTPDHLCNTVGKIADGVSIEIRDFKTDKAIESSPSNKGEIVVKGVSAMTAYYKLPAGSQALDAQGWVRTGDFGFFDEDGYLHIGGRMKELIHAGEHTIEPNEVGAAITLYDPVSDVKVVAVPDEALGSKPVACISLKQGTTFEKDELIKLLSEHLDAYKIPSDYIIYDKLPTLANGKVDAVALKSDAANRLSVS